MIDRAELERLVEQLNNCELDVKGNHWSGYVRVNNVLLQRAIDALRANSAALLELEKDARRWRALKELAGHWQDGSHTRVILDQDDATRTAFIAVGNDSHRRTHYSVAGCGFDAAIDAKLKDVE